MKPICHIVCAGDFDKESFAPRDGDFIIACDAGLASLEHIGAVPNIIVGDFDSYNGVPSGENVVILPREKDDTDSAYALKLGLARGFTKFILHGALGGARISHSVANMLLLVFLKKNGAEGLLCGKNTCASLLSDGRIDFSAEERGYLSVFSVTSNCTVTLKGLKFPFCGELSPSFPLGVSNEFIGCPAMIDVCGGSVLWICEGVSGDPARFFAK